MTNFEDQLFSDLMTEHGAELRQLPPPGRGAAAGLAHARWRAARRPAWLATGAAGLAAAISVAVTTLGGAAPASAAYAVSRGADGAVHVSVSRSSGVTEANAALRRMRVRISTVPVRAGCPALSSLPRPRLTHPPAVIISIGASSRPGGHRSISVTVGSARIPADATMVLAFTTHGRTLLGADRWITGPVPACVSLPKAPGGQGR
jgi:hypothetical protein